LEDTDLSADLSDVNAFHRLIGMIRSPYATLNRAVEQPRSIDLAALILLICAICSVGFLLTPVGRLAALDQHVRQLELFGTVVTDDVYANVRRWQPYRPLMSGAAILIGWPIIWVGLAAIFAMIGTGRARGTATFAQALTILVHASSVFALRAVIATPINYSRESLGGATSLRMLIPGAGESTFLARLLGGIDIFVVWWVVLVVMGLSILYQTRLVSVAGWLFGAYVAGVAALAFVQASRGGM
jgi:hypothetical protein